MNKMKLSHDESIEMLLNRIEAIEKNCQYNKEVGSFKDACCSKIDKEDLRKSIAITEEALDELADELLDALREDNKKEASRSFLNESIPLSKIQQPEEGRDL